MRITKKETTPNLECVNRPSFIAYAFLLIDNFTRIQYIFINEKKKKKKSYACAPTPMSSLPARFCHIQLISYYVLASHRFRLIEKVKIIKALLEKCVL